MILWKHPVIFKISISPKKFAPSQPLYYSWHTKTPKPRLSSQKDMAHKAAVVPHAWTIISNSWKLDLSFDCFKTTITSESKAFSSKRSNGPWKQNSCEFCLHIKVGNCYKIIPHSSWVVTYKMQNLVASHRRNIFSCFNVQSTRLSAQGWNRGVAC